MTLPPTVGTVTYDAGALIAAENNQQRMWEFHRRTLRRGVQPIVPSVVLAQAWRGGPQPSLSRLLTGCMIEPLGEAAARTVGRLLGAARRSDIVDAVVVVSAAARRDSVVTSDAGDLAALAKALGRDLRLISV